MKKQAFRRMRDAVTRRVAYTRAVVVARERYFAELTARLHSDAALVRDGYLPKSWERRR